VPFCHPCVREGGKWVDKIESLGWEFVSHQQMGTCVWGQAEDVDDIAHAPGDAFGLGWLPLPAAPSGVVQFPRPDMGLEASRAAGYDHVLGLSGLASRPTRGDEVIPVISVVKGGQAVGHPVCAIEHHCPEFSGAIDVWAGCTLNGQFTMQQQEQLIVASCAYVLERVGAMSGERRGEALQATRRRYVQPNMATPEPFEPFIQRAPGPGPRLTVLDVGGMPADEQILALSLQGIVNRRRPRIWVLSQFQDEKWLGLMLAGAMNRAPTQSGAMNGAPTRGRDESRPYTGGMRERVDCPSLEALVKEFGGEAQGAILYDPAEPHSVNVATTLAGVRDAVMATPELATKLGLRTVEDVRGKCGDPVAAYERVLEEHWGELNHRAAACLQPEVTAPRDYLVQQRIFTFWLDAEREFRVPPEQVLFFERLLARLPAHAAIHGWWQEGEEGGIGEWRGVYVASQYAKITVCTSGAYNLSAQCGEPMPERLTNRPIEFGSLDKKVYISFIISDGDNFGMNLYGVIGGLWEQSLRGKIPIGWALCPTQIELSPDAVRYWYETATPNDLLFAMDGLGYVYPDVYGTALLGAMNRAPTRGRDESRPYTIYEGFLRLTRPYMQRLDQRYLWFLGGSSRAEE
ncbi:MAG: hypothetical protein FJX75_30060, partial [Armatimonadetes bacterium]|nr:hypothetical protein [Armatimonadota bacterium]